MIFQVRDKATDKVVNVYSVRTLDQSSWGKTEFLIFEKTEELWVWRSAQSFEPLK